MFKKRRYRRSLTRYKGNNISYFSILAVILLVVLGVICIQVGINFEAKELPIYSYVADKTSDYEVLLKPNDFYTTPTLPSNRYYASKSVDSYIIDFNYNFNANKQTNLQYKYNVTAEIVGTVNSNINQGKEVWNRTFVLLDNKNIDVYENTFDINERINIDYDYYNDLARAYENTYGIAIDAVLKVRFNIYTNINLETETINNEALEDYIEFDIAITDTVTNASENYQHITEKAIVNNNENITINEIIFYIIGGVFIILAILLVILIIRQKNKMPEEVYKSNIKRILKYYRDLIVTVKNKPNLDNLNIMKIDMLEDLIDVAEQTKSNIIHYETIEDEESTLYVIVNNYVYIYVVTNQKLK